MCGIAGLVWKTVAGRRVEDFRRSAALIRHRGPDGRGEFLDDHLLLIHYRLAILDLSESGTQPYRTSGARPTVGVYNGELYNFREIAERTGIARRSSCDTEVVFERLAASGFDALEDFNGIFALANYCPARGQLLLARDRLGVKPLYFLDSSDFFAFASEAKVLYDFMDEMMLDASVLREFFAFGSSMSNRTMVHGVRKLPPGTVLEFDTASFKHVIKPFWSVETLAARKTPPDKRPQAGEHVAGLLAQAVRRQCLSDVPVGAYLSGGLDSSIIVALAAEHTGTPLKTFSVQFEGSSNSELPLARQVAQRYGTEHHEMEISPRDLVGDLPDLICQYDEPFADPAALPLHLMAARCAPMAKVILQGDGGDELFAGYGRHLDMSQRRRRLIAFGLLAHVHPKPAVRARFQSRYRALAARPLSRRLALLSGQPDFDSFGQVLKGKIAALVQTSDPLQTFQLAAQVVRRCDPATQTLLADMMTILPNTFLEKVDKVSMWHGIEARVPFLDNELVDYVARLPSRFKIHGGVTKILLREIAGDLLPRDVVRGRKHSFGTPMGIWMRSLLVDFALEVLDGAEKHWAEWFDFPVIRKLFEAHRAGREDHSGLLWRLIVLFVWLERYRGKIRLMPAEGAETR